MRNLGRRRAISQRARCLSCALLKSYPVKMSILNEPRNPNRAHLDTILGGEKSSTTSSRKLPSKKAGMLWTEEATQSSSLRSGRSLPELSAAETAGLSSLSSSESLSQEPLRQRAIESRSGNCRSSDESEAISSKKQKTMFNFTPTATWTSVATVKSRYTLIDWRVHDNIACCWLSWTHSQGIPWQMRWSHTVVVYVIECLFFMLSFLFSLSLSLSLDISSLYAIFSLLYTLHALVCFQSLMMSRLVCVFILSFFLFFFHLLFYFVYLFASYYYIHSILQIILFLQIFNYF